MKVLILKDIGTIGLITYLRTDSTRISEEADSAGEFIADQYGSEYVTDKIRQKNTKRFRMLMKQFVQPMLILLLMLLRNSLQETNSDCIS